jgi:hypothetical protein|nr:MAG TPA: hypothetical protein [Caudoviricetes sp.]
MGKISTKQLISRYFKSIEGTPAEKQRAIIDKTELYDYEEKIGKELIDMDVDDLFGLINELNNKKNGKDIPFMTAHYSFDHLTVLLRAIFNFYIDTVEPIKNPLYDKRMKGKEATKRLAQGKETLRFDYVQSIINKVHNDTTEDRADYVELIMLLYYSGFENAEEIATFKGSAINHRNRTVAMTGRTVQLTDRCYELLQKFEGIDELVEWRTYYLTTYRGGYFKFIVQEKQLAEFDDRDIRSICNMINRQISVYVNQPYNTKINFSILYWLGFYDSIVKKYGEEETNRMLLSFRNSDDVTKLMNCARDYGVKVDNISHLKRFLRPFVKVD